MHLCAKDRHKKRLYTACKELMTHLIIVCNNQSCMSWKREASEKCYMKLICHINKRHPRMY